MEATNQHHEHVPQTKPFVTYLVYAATGLSVLVLALCAYAVSVYNNIFLWGDVLNPALGLTMFTCILTWFFCAFWIFFPRKFSHLYNKWIVVGVFGFTVFFWLVSFALLASRVSDTSFLNDNLYGFSSSSSFFKRSPEPKKTTSSSSSSVFGSSRSSTGSYTKYQTAWKVAAAASGIGALIWILLVVAMVFFVLAVLAHQASGASDSYEGEPKPMPPAAPGHEMNNYAAPASTTTPNPEQQFAHNQQYGANQYDQGAYNQQQQPQHHIPT